MNTRANSYKNRSDVQGLPARYGALVTAFDANFVPQWNGQAVIFD
jgi:hypothetical protein